MRGEESVCSMLGQTRCLLPIVQSEPQEQPSACETCENIVRTPQAVQLKHAEERRRPSSRQENSTGTPRVTGKQGGEEG